MDRLSEMEAFVRVVELGGFTEAAKKLGLSKSAVSKHVAGLEARLGARLLNRTTRRIAPTDIGLAYFDRASRVLSDASEADALAASMGAAPRGELRIAAPVSYGRLVLNPALLGFLEAYPDVSARVSYSDRNVELMAEGFDLAIRVGHLADSSLIARRLGEAALRIVAAPDYLRAHGEPETVEAFASRPLIHYTLSASGGSWKLKAPNGAERVVRGAGPFSSNNGDAILSAVEAGLGIAIIPDFIADASLEAGRVVELMRSFTPEPLGIWAVYPAGRHHPPKLRVFVDYLADRLGEG